MENKSTDKLVDFVVIGGGAAGLAATVMAARRGMSVCLLEKQARVGRKLLATGNGTCNISNREADSSRYHGAPAAFVKPVLAGFSSEDAAAFFASIGLECQTKERGRVYPLCSQASAVLDCLRLEIRGRGISEKCDCPVTAIACEKGGFTLSTPEGAIRARTVLLATGGCAAPALGGGMEGYSLAGQLGHSRTPLFPSIVQVRTETEQIRAVKGIRVEGTVTFRLDGRRVSSEQGEILFTEYGLSGPAVMQASRPVADWERKKQGRMEAELDLLPAWPEGKVRGVLAERRGFPGWTLEDFLTGLFQKRVGQTLLRAAGIGPFTRRADTLTEEELDAVTAVIKGWRILVTGTQGFGGAQVTAGGLKTEEFYPETLESRRVPGFYAAGEVLDVDGDCGGFNLQWAWASAHAAVEGAFARLRAKEGDR